jgi:hypothetical protein
VDLVVLDQGIDTSTAVGRMFFHILGAVAEFEHALMSQRTVDGLDAARARGRTGGQKPKLGPRQVKLAWQMHDEKDERGKRKYTVQQIAEEARRHPPHHLPPPRQSDPFDLILADGRPPSSGNAVAQSGSVSLRRS